jgi:DNA (cytosine-5)-methyltransferase 1
MKVFNIFEELYESFKIKKPIRLIELFAGYGSQALALKYLGVNFEHWKICEWAIPSIIAYADLHQEELENYGKDFCSDLTKEQIANELYNYGVSVDYNKPADIKQLKRMPEETLRLAFNSIQWTNNLVDISKTKAKDLSIKDTKNYTYLLTYSFPCQDLSLAGKRMGMADTSTRSGLLWEVERILDECEELPQVLLMENVSQVHQSGNKEYFNQWITKLEKLGYHNYWKDLSATDYGIPQTRVRTFMVSILSGNNNEEYYFGFPEKAKLNLRLKDLLEDNVDEKYYLSEKMINYISATGTENFKNCDSKINKEIARPLTTEQNNLCPTLDTRADCLGVVVKDEE